MFMLVVNAGLLGEPAINHFVPLALIYGGLVQLIAGLWEFRNQNTFASTGFCSYGAFWIALGILEIFARQLGIAEEQVPIALAWTFAAWLSLPSTCGKHRGASTRPWA